MYESPYMTENKLTVSLERENERLSRKGRRADALALRAEERRDKLRKATGSRKQAGIRRYLNGETRLAQPVTVY